MFILNKTLVNSSSFSSWFYTFTYFTRKCKISLIVCKWPTLIITGVTSSATSPKKVNKEVIFMLTCFCLPWSFPSPRQLRIEHIHFRLNWNTSRASLQIENKLRICLGKFCTYPFIWCRWKWKSFCRKRLVVESVSA